MSIKRILAAAAASVVAVSAMSVAAFAADAVTFVDKTGKATMADSGGKGDNTRVMWNTVDLLPEGVTIDQVYGFTVTFSGEYDTEAGMGGSFIFSTKGNNWNMVDWANADKAIVFDAEAKTLTRLETEPFFTETDISGAEGEYAQVVIDAWWGSGELTIESVTALDKDGKALEGGAPAESESKPEESESKPEESESKPEESESKPEESTPSTNNVETGVEGVAAVVGVAAVAAGALVVAKKRK